MKHFILLICCCAPLISQAQNSRLNRLLNLRNSVEDQSEIKRGENIDDKIKRNFFLKAEVSKKVCYVGENIMATFKAYSRVNASSRVIKRPALTGFSVLEMVDAYSNEPAVEMVSGKPFNSHLIRKVHLFPLQAGEFSLEPAVVESQIYLRNPDMVKSLSLETPPIPVSVKALPLKNQPDSFSGAVGSFSIRLQMKDREPEQFDPAVVQLVISGTGNFPLVTDPPVSWPEGLDVSQPQVTEDVNKYVFPLSGEKTFQYSVETSVLGNFTIPPVRFDYFDPVSSKYKTASTEPLNYSVKKANRKVNLDKIIHHPKEVPLQYYYFGVIVLGILAWIAYQVVRSRK